MKVRRALLSVSDKTGIEDFARALHETGVELLSSGGTAAALEAAGIPVRKVSEVTGAPEILGGRVKTLHPRIHGGILADRRREDHVVELEQQGIEAIDLVVCNLYPFEETAGSAGAQEDDVIEQIDVGGPAMVRAAAKNFHSVAVVVDPADYRRVLEEVVATGEIDEGFRRRLARRAFAHTAAYDTAIASYLGDPDEWPDQIVIAATKVTDLRYGENPHQSAAFYRSGGPRVGIAAAEQLHGKELSYNNILDADAAWRLVSELDRPEVAIIKHSNPCGAAQADLIEDADKRALEC